MACPAGVEPATYGLEGRCSIQLSYGQILAGSISELIEKMVGVQGFEPWTPCSQSRCATRLRYTPTEPIFYTDRAISGKSCKIRAMVAHFSSKFFQQTKAALAVALVAICVLGTHWFGFAHSISHAGLQQHSINQSFADESAPVLNHSTDICHLFDALTLAGFIPETFAANVSIALGITSLISHSPSLTARIAPSAYQSRAPPSLLL